MVPDRLWLHPDLTPQDTQTWCALLLSARDRMECQPTNRTLAETLKVSIRTVNYSIARLESAGFIEVDRHGPHRTIRLHPEGNGEPIRFRLQVTN